MASCSSESSSIDLARRVAVGKDLEKQHIGAGTRPRHVSQK